MCIMVWLWRLKNAMFHDLLTIHAIYQQFTHFNGLFRCFLTKKSFLCTRETSCKPSLGIAEAPPMFTSYCAHLDGRGVADVLLYN